jgi:hypothetical protein
MRTTTSANDAAGTIQRASNTASAIFFMMNSLLLDFTVSGIIHPSGQMIVGTPIPTKSCVSVTQRERFSEKENFHLELFTDRFTRFVIFLTVRFRTVSATCKIALKNCKTRQGATSVMPWHCNRLKLVFHKA